MKCIGLRPCKLELQPAFRPTKIEAWRMKSRNLHFYKCPWEFLCSLKFGIYWKCRDKRKRKWFLELLRTWLKL